MLKVSTCIIGLAVLGCAGEGLAEAVRPAGTARATTGPAVVGDGLERRLPSVHFDDAGLGEVVEHLREVTGLNIVVNWNRLADARVGKGSEVQLRLREVSIRKLLAEVCRVLPTPDAANRIAWVYDEGVVTISTAADLHSHMVTRVYDVTDVVTAQGNQQGLAKRMADLAGLVVESVEPASWDRNGGAATIQGWEKDRCLVISQLPEAHARIAAMLEELGRSSSLSVDVQVRMVEVPVEQLPPALGEALKQERPFGWYPTPEQVAQLLQRVRAGTEGAEGADAVLNTPRMSIANGGTGHAEVWTDTNYIANIRPTTRPGGAPTYQPEIGTTRSGLEVAVTPYVSKDRKSVRLVVKHEARRLLGIAETECRPVADAAETFTIHRPVTHQARFETAGSVENGRTICLGERAFRAPDGRECVLLLLVTPTIVDVTMPRGQAR